MHHEVEDFHVYEFAKVQFLHLWIVIMPSDLDLAFTQAILMRSRTARSHHTCMASAETQAYDAQHCDGARHHQSK